MNAHNQRVNDLLRRAAGRTVPEPQPEPQAQAWGSADAGAQGQPAKMTASAWMNHMIRQRVYNSGFGG